MNEAAKKILIIEDDAATGKILVGTVKQLYPTLEIFQVKTIQQARELTQQQELALVILDLHLPDGFGLQYLSELSVRSLRSFPVLILTGDMREGLLKQALDLGADDFLTKPIDIVILESKVRTLLDQQYYSSLKFFKANNQTAPITLEQQVSIEKMSEHHVEFHSTTSLQPGAELVLSIFPDGVPPNLDFPVKVLNSKKNLSTSLFQITAEIKNPLTPELESRLRRFVMSLERV